MSESARTQTLQNAPRLGVQYAALPYRVVDTIEILLLTSRETRRWVIPKGWPMKGKKPHTAAAREAYEEAGLIGTISKEPIGTYHYVKRLANGAPVDCSVEVFPLQVAIQRQQWPEQQQRTTQWFNVEEAVAAVQESELKDLIERWGRTVGLVAVPSSLPCSIIVN